VSAKPLNSLQVANRAHEAYKLRLAGHSYREIASMIGLSKSEVHRCCEEWREDHLLATEEAAHTLRADESARLDSMLLALQPKIEAGEERAIDTALRIQARRAALWGIDAPTRAEVAGTVNIKISLE
jgi:transposase